MTALKRQTYRLRRLARAVARFTVYAMSNPAMACHTPVGPGSLATGQAGIGGLSGPAIRGQAEADSKAGDCPAILTYP